jgi:hypothetical protein
MIINHNAEHQSTFLRGFVSTPFSWKSAVSPENEFREFCQSSFLFNVYPLKCLGVSHKQGNAILRFSIFHQMLTVCFSIKARDGKL